MYSLLHTTAPTVQTIQLLNCCRVLTRIIPFIFESPECSEWEEKFFWTPRLIESLPNPDSEPDQKQSAQYRHLPSRGEQLLSSMYSRFTLSIFYQPVF